MQLERGVKTLIRVESSRNFTGGREYRIEHDRDGAYIRSDTNCPSYVGSLVSAQWEMVMPPDAQEQVKVTTQAVNPLQLASDVSHLVLLGNSTLFTNGREYLIEHAIDGAYIRNDNKDPIPVRVLNPTKWAAVQPKDKQTVSDGGSSKYYQLQVLVDDKQLDLNSETGLTTVSLETGDVIRMLVGNDFDLGNIVKALRRIHMNANGAGKAGTTVEYDCKKIEYFLEQWYQNYCKEQM